MKSFEICRTFTGGLDDLGLLHDWLDTLAGEEFVVNATTLLRIRQILAEGFSNAVQHAHRGELGRPVVVYIVYQPQIDPFLRLEVKDTGTGFELPPPREPHEHAERGRGFLILRALAERVEYRDNTLRVWLRPAADKS